jgi:hypothetical protein
VLTVLLPSDFSSTVAICNVAGCLSLALTTWKENGQHNLYLFLEKPGVGLKLKKNNFLFAFFFVFGYYYALINLLFSRFEY